MGAVLPKHCLLSACRTTSMWMIHMSISLTSFITCVSRCALTIPLFLSWYSVRDIDYGATRTVCVTGCRRIAAGLGSKVYGVWSTYKTNRGLTHTASISLTPSLSRDQKKSSCISLSCLKFILILFRQNIFLEYVVHGSKNPCVI